MGLILKCHVRVLAWRSRLLDLLLSDRQRLEVAFRFQNRPGNPREADGGLSGDVIAQPQQMWLRDLLHLSFLGD